MAKLADTYCPGDMLRVQDKSRADVVLTNQSVLRLNANTLMTFEAAKAERSSVVSMFQGAAHLFSRMPRSLEVNTPFTVAGVRGTEFFIRVEPTHTFLSIFTGQVVATNSAGSLTLDGGQSAIAEAGKAPALRVVARPRDAVQWALYYPPVLYGRAVPLPADAEAARLLKQATALTTQGDLQQAFARLAAVPEALHDASFLTVRASLLLAVGDVEQARADVERVLRLAPKNSQALALYSIMAVVRQDKASALERAQQAVAADAASATAWLALSYAQQAHFQLEEARRSLDTAVRVEPENALAWARLAELYAASGQLPEALRAADKAVALAPELSRTQTVLGFIALLRGQTTQAIHALTKAMRFDQADPLPRLGLGLAYIRQGELETGREQIEIAASLDPNNPLVRSYLGKTYYEEKNPKVAREYSVAKELDPQDPTPWLYDAIHKQTSNRPVEALHDFQQAIALNDNRAVYRSRLLLDADLAARSASLARVYSDLGFQQLALVEGWKSVNTDPSNFSAHRLLADSYAVLPRHEIARVSELLQSQLLQPLNLTPIQPRLAESNLFLVSAGGPGALSFNEFNPLFNRNRLTVQLSSLAGENDTWSGEGVLSGIVDNVSFSVGGSHFTTAGFRANSDQRDTIVNAFAQMSLSAATSVQAEYRYRDSARGDLRLSFFPDEFSPGLRNTEERHTARLGVRHTLEPGSTLLASLLYQDAVFALHDTRPNSSEVTAFTQRRPEQAFGVEVQHLWQTRHFHLTSGIGYFNVHGTLRSLVELSDPPLLIPNTVSTDLQHVNLYTYGSLQLPYNVTLTVGLSADFLRTESLDVGNDQQVHPKFGLTWKPWPGTTIRAAAFRALKRTLITDQTLEPTQVAGFNQFFDDANGTRAWRYGGAIDQKFTHSLFGGLEFSKRDLRVASLDFSVDPENPTSRRVAWDESLGRAYLFWTPHPWLALRGEYTYERFEHDRRFTFGVRQVETHRMLLGLRAFHPSGVSATVQATYVHQEGEFERTIDDEDVLTSGQDTFWTVDMTLNYRLPQRFGFVTLGVTNLLDHRFKFFDVDRDNPSLQPSRMVFARGTLVFP